MDQTTRASGAPSPSAGKAAEHPTSGQRLGRYRLIREVGRGGMGRVFEAEDSVLQRSVAIKVLHDRDPSRSTRFVREARTQATVEHEHVCPILDVGETDGTPYIVMPLIDGRPLEAAADGMPLERKLLVIQKVAEAVHAAHEQGLIHRDLKPSNVMVVDDGGRPKPFVVDFGIARRAGEDGETVDGAQIGTPGFMAPEQLRGEGRALDRRADVYGLGATVFRLLEGRSPPTPNPWTAVDPPPSMASEIPIDVRTIVRKCLEHDAADRYPSARAVAEELARYLSGEPIQARPLPPWGPWLRRARRHPRLTLIMTVLALAAAASLTVGVVTTVRSALRERGIRRFTEQIDKIESEARFSLLAPTHNIEPDRRRLRARMKMLHSEADTYGVPGLADYALGRGHLALGELEAARTSLEAAWSAGYRASRAAEALGRVRSAQYRRELVELELVEDESARRQHAQNLAHEYRHEILAYLRAASDDPDTQAFLQTLIAFHEERFDDALAGLSTVRRRFPWWQETWLLEGDIYRTQGLSAAAAGQTEAATAALDRAFLAYRSAHNVAKSDPAAGRGAMKATYLRLRLGALQDVALQPELRRGLDMGNTALASAPKDGQSWLWKGRLHSLMAHALRSRGQDPRMELQASLAALDRAAGLLKNPGPAHLEAGRAYWRRAQWRLDRAQSPEDDLRAASAAFEKVDVARRDYRFFMALGRIYFTRAGAAVRTSSPAAELYDQSIAAFERATTHHAAPFGALSNWGMALIRRADLEPGHRERFVQARQVFQRATALRPTHVAPHYYLGLVELRIAQRADPEASVLDDGVDGAIEHLKQAIELNAKLPQAYGVLGRAYHLRARRVGEAGGDPEPDFVRAFETYERGTSIASTQSVLHQNWAWAHYFRAKHAVRTGTGSPQRDFAEALRKSERALKTGGKHGAKLCIASVYRIRAEFEWKRGRNPAKDLRMARATFDALIKERPGLVEVWRSSARLATLQARWNLQNGQDAEDALSRAWADVTRAQSLRSLAVVQLALVRLALVSSGGKAFSRRSEAVAAIRALRDQRPNWPEGLAAEACLLSGVDSSRLADVLASAPHLRADWADCLASR